MPTTWGTVEAVVDRQDGSGKVVIRTKQSGHDELTVHVGVSAQTLIARGIRRIALADVRVGEFVELSYHSNLNGVEAESIYVRSEPRGLSEARSA